MSNRHGTPIWYELMTDQPDNALEFYAAVMSWNFEAMPGDPTMGYHIANAGKETVAGVMRTPDHAQGMPNTWFFYVGVDDVDASAEKVKSLGGRINIEPTNIPGVGRFAFCEDPQGAKFYVMRGESEEGSNAFATETAGHCGWNELVTSDQTAALEFYSKLFGWKKSGVMPMENSGDYTFIGLGGTAIGAFMDTADIDKDEAPHWNFAFQVADIDNAKKTTEKAEGTVRVGPIELPDNSGWLILATDPQGAGVMFTGPRKG